MSADTALPTSETQTRPDMKRTILSFILITAVALPALALPGPGINNNIGENILPAATRHHLREIAQAVTRNFLNFRKETPLSPDQRQKISEILETHRADIHSLIVRGRDARRTCVSTVKSSGPEAAATREAAEKIGTVARDRALLMARMGSEVRPLLSPGQQQRLESGREEIEGLIDQALASVGQ